MSAKRQTFTALSDGALLEQCAVDTYRASGPGGQKRNKTSSAVRVRHLPTGLIVSAEESRSQHEKRERSLRRLQQALYLTLRDPLAVADLTPQAWATRADWTACKTAAGRLDLRRKDPRFWPAAGMVLDVLDAGSARARGTARILGLTTGNL